VILRLLAAFLLAPLWAAPVYAQTYTFTPQSSKDLTLTFQTEREGASRVLILGEVRNSSSQPCGRVVVKAEGLDENGRVVSRGRAFVFGVVPSRGSSPFEVRMSSPGTEKRFRVEIESFQFVSSSGN